MMHRNAEGPVLFYSYDSLRSLSHSLLMKYYLTRPSKRGDRGAWAGQNVSPLPQILHIYLDETLALIRWGGAGVGMSGSFCFLINYNARSGTGV